MDGIQGIADILAFGRGGDRAGQIARTGSSYGATQKQMARISAVHSALGIFLTNLGLWLVLVLVIPQVTAGNLEGVMLGTFALMTLASFEAVTPLPLAAQMWNESREAAKRLFEVVDAEPAVKEDIRYSNADARSSDIEFSHLTFAYPAQASPALQDVTFTVIYEIPIKWLIMTKRLPKRINGEKYRKEHKIKRETYEHQKVLNQIVKLAIATPMPDALKQVVLWRIWGYYPKQYAPLNVYQIAFIFVKEGYFSKTIDPEEAKQKVLEMEKEAKANMKLYLARHEIKDVVGKINSTEDGGKGMLDGTGKLII